jgi:protein KRI1
VQKKYGSEESEATDSEDDVTEDEVAEFVTEQVDAEIAATLAAIKNRDPRIYDKSSKFYSDIDAESTPKSEKEKPLYLREYHRQNLLNGQTGAEEQEDETLPYSEEQQVLRDSFLKAVDDAGEDGDDFLVQKPRIKNSAAMDKPAPPDPSTAEQDPELYLSNFMSSRAWAPVGPAALEPFESDDSEEEEHAEEFESAWNLRFENPEMSNTVLLSHSRDLVAKSSVRKGETKSTRQRARDREREKKEEEKSEREKDRSRLKKLKMDEISEKLSRIRENAGFFGADDADNIDVAKWRDLLEGDWNDESFDQEMTKRFGENYYGQKETERKEPKKPKWKDDIDVKDIVSDESGADSGLEEQVQESTNKLSKKAKTKLDSSKRKRDARVISALAENALDVPEPTSGQYFRYRDTSPTSFGMTTLDILTASDAQLNEFAGLKKLATWRDPERKQKDKKKLGKRARLRKWREETFGNEEGPQFDAPKDVSVTVGEQSVGIEDEVKLKDGERKKKKKRRGKKAGGEDQE